MLIVIALGGNALLQLTVGFHKASRHESERATYLPYFAIITRLVLTALRDFLVIFFVEHARHASNTCERLRYILSHEVP